jgi:hypothetical protein
MKQLILTTITCILLTTVYAQANKSVFLEIGGNGMAFSANFDSRFTKSEKGFGYRVGVGGIPATNSNVDILYPSTPFVLSVPVAINHLAGKAPNYFESGLGFTYMYTSGTISSDFWGYEEDITGSYAAFVPSIGYRHAKAGKAFQYRVILSPVFAKGGTTFWGGFSAGYKF